MIVNDKNILNFTEQNVISKDIFNYYKLSAMNPKSVFLLNKEIE